MNIDFLEIELDMLLEELEELNAEIYTQIKELEGLENEMK